VLDLMIHDIGIILALIRSPVARLESVGVSVLSEREDIANARIVFENGCVANINTSRVSEKKVREIRVFQPSTYISLNFMSQSGHLMYKKGVGLSRREIPIEKGDPLFLEIESFINCVERIEHPRVGASLGFSALEIALQITEQIHWK
jgi:predicted dehydrogenase